MPIRPGLGNVNPNVNGMRAGSNNLLIDGLPAFNALNNSNTGIGAPSPDFLQEFKVMTSMFSAEYGRNAGSVVNVVTVSGTNQIHGSAWEFLRNTKLNARPFFAAARGQNNQNQFGASVGGPVVLPKTLQRQGPHLLLLRLRRARRQRNSNSSSALSRQSVPTAAMRAGTFRKLVRDPLTGLPCTATDARGCFPGNQIPASRIDSDLARRHGQVHPAAERIHRRPHQFRRRPHHQRRQRPVCDAAGSQLLEQGPLHRPLVLEHHAADRSLRRLAVPRDGVAELPR